MPSAARHTVAAPDARAVVHNGKPAPALRTRLTLRPGENGTKKLLAKYGARLLAVRYRYDLAGQRRLKTVELIEEELPWDAPPPDRQRAPVLLRIAFEETALRQAVKSAGAIWNRERKLWQLPYAAARALGLEARIVE